MQLTDGFIIVRRNTVSIIDDFNCFEAVVFEANFYSGPVAYACQVYGMGRQQGY
jgi:hypothetical protein